MKSFWWFKHNSIAGMARPGFNSARWFDFGFEEGVLLGWMGQHSSGIHSRSELKKHIQHYAPRIFKFYQHTEQTGQKALELFDSPKEIEILLQQMNRRGQFFKDFGVTDSDIHFELNPERIDTEIKSLKSHRVQHIVTLTEKHHQKEILQEHFSVHHISIQDLQAPTLDQVKELVEILRLALRDKQVVAVHCLAGIGRTSTMLMAAHVLMGERPEELVALLQRQNPSFTLTGPQGEFLRSLQN